MNDRPLIKNLALGLFFVIIIFAGYYVLNIPDQRTDGQKIGNAIDQMSNGVDKAARELEPRTLGDKLDDAAKDAFSKRNDQNKPY